MALPLASLPRILFLLLVLFWLSLTLARAEEPRPFGLNDLSVLLPLPHSEEEAEYLLRPSDSANGGELIPASLLRRLPNLVIGGDPSESRENLRVLALRFDPCFKEGDEPCRRQIRLVLQPLGVHRRAYLTTDAAVHVFYDFAPDAWERVMRDWRATAVGTKAEALAVHPLIEKQGLGGSQWAKLRGIVQRNCGPATLTRITVSNVNLFGTQWAFVGHNVAADGSSAPIQVARLTTPGQVFVGDLGNLREFFGQIFPAPTQDPELVKLWTHSVGARDTLPPEALAKALSRTVAFENPRLFHPGNVDCVSCHLAQNTNLWGQRNFPEWFTTGKWQSMIERDRFRSAGGWNLARTSSPDGFTNRVRAFGYFVDEPVISQRVINETAAVAELVEASLSKAQSASLSKAQSASLSKAQSASLSKAQSASLTKVQPASPPNF